MSSNEERERAGNYSISEAAAAKCCDNRLEYGVHALGQWGAGGQGGESAGQSAGVGSAPAVAALLLQTAVLHSAIMRSACLRHHIAGPPPLTSFHRRTAHARVVAPSHGCSACRAQQQEDVQVGR